MPRFLTLRFCISLLMGALIAIGPASGAQATDGKAEATAAPAYQLGSGDKIRVTVFGEQSLNGEYPVGPDGTVALPLVGNVMAKGLSIAELQQAIAAKLSPAFILDPRVAVDVVNFRPFYILGEVARPGSYPYVDSLSAQQAVAIAGGYTYRASTRKVHIRHAGSPAETEYSINKDSQVWIKPGDTIRIGQRIF